jgi:hypothetical protein
MASRKPATLTVSRLKVLSTGLPRGTQGALNGHQTTRPGAPNGHQTTCQRAPNPSPADRVAVGMQRRPRRAQFLGNTRIMLILPSAASGQETPAQGKEKSRTNLTCIQTPGAYNRIRNEDYGGKGTLPAGTGVDCPSPREVVMLQAMGVHHAARVLHAGGSCSSVDDV